MTNKWIMVIVFHFGKHNPEKTESYFIITSKLSPKKSNYESTSNERINKKL